MMSLPIFIFLTQTCGARVLVNASLIRWVSEPSKKKLAKGTLVSFLGEETVGEFRESPMTIEELIWDAIRDAIMEVGGRMPAGDFLETDLDEGDMLKPPAVVGDGGSASSPTRKNRVKGGGA